MQQVDIQHFSFGLSALNSLLRIFSAICCGFLSLIVQPSFLYLIEEHSNKIQATMDYVVANEAKAQGKAIDKMARAEGKATIRKEKDFER